MRSARPPSSTLALKTSAPAEPLFLQVRNRLRKDILARRIAPGAKLPSEAMLQAAFKVSRITVRQALAELATEGLIETVNGKGSFVTRPANAPLLGQLAGFNAVMHARGLRTSGQLLKSGLGRITPAVARALALPAQKQVMTIHTLRLVEDVPTAHATVVCEPQLGKKLLALGLESEDVMTLLEEQLELHLECTHIEASSISATPKDAQLLNIAPGTPLLLMHFVPHDMLGRPLLYAEMRFRHDRFSYRTVIRR